MHACNAGEEETDLDLGDLIKKGEVAWLSTQEMLKASEANNAAYNGTHPQPHALLCASSGSADSQICSHKEHGDALA